MCFVLPWLTRLEAKVAAPALSHQTTGIWIGFICNSVSKDVDQINVVVNAVVTLAKAWYSDSQLDIATTNYFLEDHDTRLLPKYTK